MMYVGVDVHKNVCRAAIVNDEGVLVLVFCIFSVFFSGSSVYRFMSML